MKMDSHVGPLEVGANRLMIKCKEYTYAKVETLRRCS